MIGRCSTHTASASSAPSSPAAPSRPRPTTSASPRRRSASTSRPWQKETGLTLFQRVGRGIAPTEAALVLDAQTDEVMSQWGRLDAGRRRPARRPLWPAVDRLLRLGRRRVDAVARQAADRRVPRPRARARAHRGGAAGAGARHRPRHRPAGPRAGGRLPADRAHRGPVRRDRAARPPPGGRRVDRPGRPARRDLGQQRLPALPTATGWSWRRAVPPASAPASACRRRTTTRRSGSWRPGSGCRCCPGWRRAACRPPSCGSASRHPRPVRHLAAVVRDVGAPNPASERAVELLTELIAHPSGRTRRAVAV